MISFRSPRATEAEQIKRLAVATEMFGDDEVSFFDDLLTGFFDGSLVDNYWSVATNVDDEIIAASYVAPEPFADRLWNLHFISVLPEHQVRGTGASLIRAIEDMLRSLGEEKARVLIVETSSTHQYAGARAFYRRLDFDEEARIREFYGPSDDKVTFWKSLVSTP
jgi:ribosomal protein S18 acetylase RimI-like enzyme